MMAEPGYKIYQDWKEVVVYDEGDDRTIRFNCGSVDAPLQVTVPNEKDWPAETPPWAHERRQLILDRLRSANCIVHEAGISETTILSPDGTFRIQISFVDDAPFRPIESIRIFDISRNTAVANLAGTRLTGTAQFPGPGRVVLPINFQGYAYVINVDVINLTFSIPPDQLAQPLDQLGAVLVQKSGIVLKREPRKLPVPSVASSIGYLLIAIAAVGGGIWQLIDGHTRKDQILGALCAVFFFFCAIVPLNELRRRYKQ